jgi:hypothetical protein
MKILLIEREKFAVSLKKKKNREIQEFEGKKEI